jgi:hypothetical protein
MSETTTDEFTARYNELCTDKGSELRGAIERQRLPAKLAAAHGDGRLARPFFLGEHEVRQFGEDLIGFFDLLVDLPARLFDGNVDRYCAAVGIAPAKMAVMRRLGVNPIMHGRADLHHDGTSFKLLEFNIGTHLGGTDRAELMHFLLQDDVFGAFAEDSGLSYVHTGERIARTLRALGESVTGGSEPVIAFVEADGGLAPYLHLVLAFQEMMTRLGLDVRLAEVGQVSSRDDKLYLDGTPIDVVLRYFSVNQLCADGADGSAAEPFFRAHEAGRTLLYTPLDGLLFEQKTSLALMSEAGSRGVFTTAETELVDRVLPWTRIVADGPTDVDGHSIDLFDYCRENQSELIIKPAGEDGGQGIVLGWTAEESRWKEALSESANGGGYLVQHRVRPRPEQVVDAGSGVVKDWFATWGMFLTPEGYGGFHVRALPSQDGALVYAQRDPVRKTGVFHYPDQP